MSTTYYFSGPGKRPEYKSLIKKLKDRGIVEQCGSGSKTEKCLTDGDNFLWAFVENGIITCFERYGTNTVEDILTLISSVTELEIIDEFEMMDQETSYLVGGVANSDFSRAEARE
jgi:hypothetical protein